MNKIALAGFLFLVSCAHHEDVRPGANGVHRVIVRGADKAAVEHSAIEQAGYYCKESKKKSVITEESVKYTGSMDENTHNTIRRASKAVGVIGGSHGNTTAMDASTAGDI